MVVRVHLLLIVRTAPHQQGYMAEAESGVQIIRTFVTKLPGIFRRRLWMDTLYGVQADHKNNVEVG